MACEIYEMRFSRGQITQEMTVVGKTDHTGTTVTFKPDPEIFKETTIYNYLLHYLLFPILDDLNPSHL